MDRSRSSQKSGAGKAFRVSVSLAALPSRLAWSLRSRGTVGSGAGVTLADCGSSPRTKALVKHLHLRSEFGGSHERGLASAFPGDLHSAGFWASVVRCGVLARERGKDARWWTPGRGEHGIVYKTHRGGPATPRSSQPRRDGRPRRDSTQGRCRAVRSGEGRKLALGGEVSSRQHTGCGGQPGGRLTTARRGDLRWGSPVPGNASRPPDTPPCPRCSHRGAREHAEYHSQRPPRDRCVPSNAALLVPAALALMPALASHPAQARPRPCTASRVRCWALPTRTRCWS